MPLNNELKSSYEAVLQDLQEEREQVQQQLSGLQARLKELHYSISTLTKRLNPDATPLKSQIVSRQPNHQKYRNMSVRWAILDLLSKSQGMTTAEIADALIEAGIQTKAANFSNNVSAVLATMKDKDEVQPLPDGRWQLTETGHSASEHIRTKLNFRAAAYGRSTGARF